MAAVPRVFPKDFREETSVTEDNYARTKRTDNWWTHTVGTVQVDNQWVVCHSPYLIRKYRCHINVESIASIKALKYIYKYVYKGHDCTTMEFGSCVDEISQYLDAKYVSSCEAAWRLYFFEVQDHSPSVMRLQVHLPNQQGVILNPDRHANLQAALEDLSVRDTTLTA